MAQFRRERLPKASQKRHRFSQMLVNTVIRCLMTELPILNLRSLPATNIMYPYVRFSMLNGAGIYAVMHFGLHMHDYEPIGTTDFVRATQRRPSPFYSLQ